MQPTATKLCKLIYFGRKFYCWENVNLSRVNGHCWGKFVTFLGGKVVTFGGSWHEGRTVFCLEWIGSPCRCRITTRQLSTLNPIWPISRYVDSIKFVGHMFCVQITSLRGNCLQHQNCSRIANGCNQSVGFQEQGYPAAFPSSSLHPEASQGKRQTISEYSFWSCRLFGDGFYCICFDHPRYGNAALILLLVGGCMKPTLFGSKQAKLRRHVSRISFAFWYTLGVPISAYWHPHLKMFPTDQRTGGARVGQSVRCVCVCVCVGGRGGW